MQRSKVTEAVTTPQSQQLLLQMYAAIDGAAVTERYAALLGRPVQFSPEDIRALAITGFIQQNRGRK